MLGDRGCKGYARIEDCTYRLHDVFLASIDHTNPAMLEAHC